MYNQAGMWEQAHKVGTGAAVCVFCVRLIGSAVCVFCVCLIGLAVCVFCVRLIGLAVCDFCVRLIGLAVFLFVCACLIGMAVCVFCVCLIGSAVFVFCVCLIKSTVYVFCVCPIKSAVSVFCVCPIGSAVYFPLDLLCMSHWISCVCPMLQGRSGSASLTKLAVLLVKSKMGGARGAVFWLCCLLDRWFPRLMMCALSPAGSGRVCAVCWTDGSHA